MLIIYIILDIIVLIIIGCSLFYIILKCTDIVSTLSC